MKENPGRYWWLALLAGCALGYVTAITPPAAGFAQPDLARILLWHLPCALLSSVFVFMGGYWAVRTLSNPIPTNESRLSASLDVATLLAVLTLTTGMVFSEVQWGQWWSWDPRQTSYLFVTLILLGGLSLRAGIDDEAKRAKAIAGYALVMLVPIAFLTFVYPRLPQVQSLHPSDTVQQGKLSPVYRQGVLAGLIAIGMACSLLWRMRVLASEKELQWGDVGDGAGDRNRGGGNRADVVDDQPPA